MCRVYETLISADEKINCQIFNTGNKNYKIKDIALKIKDIFKNRLDRDILLDTTHSDDKRSYRLNSEELETTLNFSFRYDIDSAVNDLIDSFEKNYLRQIQ